MAEQNTPTEESKTTAPATPADKVKAMEEKTGQQLWLRVLTAILLVVGMSAIAAWLGDRFGAAMYKRIEELTEEKAANLVANTQEVAQPLLASAQGVDVTPESVQKASEEAVAFARRVAGV